MDRDAVALPYAADFAKLHYHDRYEFGICVSGSGLFLSNGVYYSFSQGDMVFIPPDTPHYSRSIDEEQLSYARFFYVFAPAVTACLGDVPAVSVPAVIRQGEHGRLYDLLRMAAERCDKADAGRDRAVVMLLALFLNDAPLYLHTAPPAEPSVKSATPASFVMEYLSLHYNESIGVRELAGMCYISESQLRRQFLAAYGMSPMAFKTEQRCRIACELLVNTALSIADIAQQLGFSSTSDFFRMFKKRHGCAPGDYRKKCRRADRMDSLHE